MNISFKSLSKIMPGRGGKGKRSTFMCDIHTPKKTCETCYHISPKRGYVGEVKSVNHNTQNVLVEFLNCTLKISLNSRFRDRMLTKCNHDRMLTKCKRGDLVLITRDKFGKGSLRHRYIQEEILELSIKKTHYPLDFDKLETEEESPSPKPVIVNSLHSILKKSLQSPCDYMSTDCIGTVRPYCVWDRTLLSVSVKVYNLLGDLCKMYSIQSYDGRSDKEDLRIWVHDIITGEKTPRGCLEELRKIVTDDNLIEDYNLSDIKKCEIRSKASCYSAYPISMGWYCSGSGSLTLSYEYCE